MARFVEVKEGVFVNTDTIATVMRGYKEKDDCTIILKDDTRIYAAYYVVDDIIGRDYVVQIIPAHDRYEIVCDNEEDPGNPFVNDCEFLAVCVNGEIRPMEEAGSGYFEFADMACNFNGLRLKK